MNILIVDDMDVFRKQIKRLKLWKDERFNLKYEASNGKEALDILIKEDVDLVIADIKMPVINGIELLKEIDDLKLPVKVVLLSEHSDFEFARNAIQYGAFDYLLKPVILEDLSKTLEKLYLDFQKNNEEEKENIYKDVVDNLIGNFLNDEENFKLAFESLKYKIDLNVEEEYFVSILGTIYLSILNGLLRENSWIENYIDIQTMKKTIFNELDVYGDLEKKLFFIKKKLDRIYILTDNLRVKGILEYILLNIDEIKDINDIAEKFYLSKTHLSYIFKENLKFTIGNYLSSIKVERGKKLIYDGLKNFEISEKLGYSSSDYFEKLFKKTTGYTPTEFRNKRELY